MTEELCKAGKHTRTPKVIRVYKYKKIFRGKTYLHDVEVCLTCLKEKRAAKHKEQT